MKKAPILLITVLATGVGLFALCTESKAQKTNNRGYIIEQSTKGITYLYPKELSPYQQQAVGDTTNYMIGKYLIQEHKMDIYLNREYVGRVNKGGTVKLDVETLSKKAEITITSAQEKIELEKPHVNKRVELLSIVFRLAERPEYSSNVFKLYYDRVEQHFEKFKNHELIQFTKSFMNERGIGYDAPMWMAIHLDDNLNLLTNINDNVWQRDPDRKSVV